MIRTTHARRRAVRPLAAAAAAATAGLFAALAGPAHAFHGLETARTAGDDRVETAAEIARQAHPDGADRALIAQAGDFPDAPQKPW